jgi:ketosteroid isomerase-like protein
MSEADVARVRAVFAAFDPRGVEAVMDLFSPEFVGVVPPELSAEPDTYVGHEGIRRYMALWQEQIDDLQMRPEELFDAGGAVVVRLRISGRGRGSRVPVELPAAVRVTMADGLITSMSAHPTVEDALAA